MELHQLQYVIAVANHRHFTRAAEEICVAQSSLSQQITKLEEELGVKLFDRTTRTVCLTSAGQEFIVYARNILAESETAKQSMQAYVGLARGKINVGAITTLETIDFVSLITSFHKSFPGLHLNIVTAGSYNLTEMLHTSEINVAILSSQVEADTNDLEIYELAQDEFVLITSKHHPLAQKPVIELSEVAGEDFIFPSPDQSIHKVYMKACRDAGFTPTIVCHSSHSETSLALVAAGMGISLFPLDTLNATNPSGISAIHLAVPLRKHIAMALLRRPYYAPPVAAFRNYVLDWVKKRE